MKPKILIVAEDGIAKNLPHFMINISYGEAVARAGGLPIVALNGNCIEEYADMCDGLLLTDGPFVYPAGYGEICKPTDTMPEIARKREVMEFTLCKRMIEKGKSVLGINRGMNLINAVLGGKLENGEDCQNIKALAKPLKATCYSEDGQIVGFCHESLNVRGIKCAPDKLDEKAFEDFIKGVAK